MNRKTIKPSRHGCVEHPWWGAWQYKHYWNGNNRKVLPWWTGTSGLARSGWRCFHCGEFAWDLDDFTYEAQQAVALQIVKLPHPIDKERGK